MAYVTISVSVNRPFPCLRGQDGERGQYTHKVYHLGGRVPGWLKKIVPEELLHLGASRGCGGGGVGCGAVAMAEVWELMRRSWTAYLLGRLFP